MVVVKNDEVDVIQLIDEGEPAEQYTEKRTTDVQQTRPSKGQVQTTLPEIGEISSLQHQSSNQATNLNEWLENQDNRLPPKTMENSASRDIIKIVEREKTSQEETGYDSRPRLDSKSDFARSLQESKIRPFSGEGSFKKRKRQSRQHLNVSESQRTIKLGNFLRSSSVKNHFRNSSNEAPNIIIQIPACQALDRQRLLYQPGTDKEHSPQLTEAQYLDDPSGQNTRESQTRHPGE